MADPETSSQAALVRGDDGEDQGPSSGSWRVRTGEKLESRRFHGVVFSLILIDCIIVVTELCYVLLDESCPRKGEEDYPHWLKVLVYISMGISCLFLLELPPHIFAFGFSYYNPFSDYNHSAFHFFDAIVIISNVAIIFLQGPAQEIAGLLVILRLWRLIKLLGGVATGAEGLNAEIQSQLADCKDNLAAKTRELDEANKQLQVLQRKFNATQP